MGHISFRVASTHPDLAFVYSKLSKLVYFPGVVHLKAAEQGLQYLMGAFEMGLTWSNPGNQQSWTFCPDGLTQTKVQTWTIWSVTGCVMVVNGAPV